MSEFQVTGEGRLDVLDEPGGEAGHDQVAGSDQAAGRRPGAWPGDGPGDWPSGWWPGDEDCYDDPDPADDAFDADPEHACWLAGLPDDVRAEYEAGPWTGDGESIPAGFLHGDGDSGRCGAGFAAGGALDALVPGPLLAKLTAAAVDGQDGPGHARLGESELIGVLRAWRRLASWAQAGEAAAVSALAARRAAQAHNRDDPNLAEHVDDEVAAALTLTGRSAGRLRSVAAGLARLPLVLAALARGEIDWARACVLVDELAGLGDEDAAEIAGSLLGRAGGWTTGQLRAALRRAVLAFDPDAARRRREAARHDAGVQVWEEPSGNAALAGRELPPAEVIAADARLTALARWLKGHGAVGTVAQLRAGAYLALLAGRPVSSLLPARAGAGGWPQLAGTVNLTLPMTTWAGLTDSPGDVAGHGPADAGTCAQLAAMTRISARWCLTLTGPGGRAVAHACARRPPPPGPGVIQWAAGLRNRLKLLESADCSHARQSARYLPPPGLAHLIKVRQRTCSFPGCRRAGGRCDLDHTIPFHLGGRTCECNLAPTRMR
ncbi:MAG: hypothetical protein ACLQFR_02820 [Streptosporangiaceae bacterium]